MGVLLGWKGTCTRLRLDVGTIDLKQLTSDLQQIAAPLRTLELMNSSRPSAASRRLHSSRVGSEAIEPDWTYLPGRTDGSQAPPA